MLPSLLFLSLVLSVLGAPSLETDESLNSSNLKVKPFRADDVDLGEPIRYDSHQVLYSFISNEKEAKLLKKYYDNSSCPVDFWKEPAVGENVTYRVPPDYVDQLTMDLKQNKLKFTVLTDNLQSWIDEEKLNFKAPMFSDKDFNATDYQINSYLEFDQIQQYIAKIAQENPSLATLDVIGTTYEGRQIRGLKLSSGAGKPVVWIDAGIHAREWISPATALSLIERIITDQKSGAGSPLDKYDIYIYPVLNADGYAYTRTRDRMWRKNRIKYQGTNCVGIDPNRNFNFNFGGEGTSPDVCSEIYRGHQAFGAQEAAAVRDGVQRYRPVFFLTMHSYSQVIMLPYGSGTKKQSQYYDEQARVACAGEAAIKATTGVNYRTGTVRAVLQTSAAGSSADWAHEVAGVKHSIALELRDTGTYGFMLPASQIEPSGKEIYAMLKAMLEALQSPSSGSSACTRGGGSGQAGGGGRFPGAGGFPGGGGSGFPWGQFPGGR